MSRTFIILLLLVHIYEVTNLPSHFKRSSKDVIPLNSVHEPEEHLTSNRKKKGPTISFQHPILVQNLHVIPLPTVHQQVHDNISHNNHSIILFPFHNLVPVHDLSVIPLHRVSEPVISYRVHNDEEDRYRNPLGGYGIGWQFGGHGAGHGFHYSFG